MTHSDTKKRFWSIRRIIPVDAWLSHKPKNPDDDTPWALEWALNRSVHSHCVYYRIGCVTLQIFTLKAWREEVYMAESCQGALEHVKRPDETKAEWAIRVESMFQEHNLAAPGDPLTPYQTRHISHPKVWTPEEIEYQNPITGVKFKGNT